MGSSGTSPNGHDEKPLDLVERLTAGCFSTFLGLFSGWLLWLVRKCLDGGGWVEEIARQILDDTALAVGLFALTFLVWVLFRPRWLARWVSWAYDHLLEAFVVFLILLLLPAFLFALYGGFQMMRR